MLDIDFGSRFFKTPAVNVEATDGSIVETLDVWVKPSFLTTRPTKDKIGQYLVPNQHAGRPHLIAETIYGTEDYDWILLAFNNVTDVFSWPKTGQMIEYPISDVVVKELS